MRRCCRCVVESYSLVGPRKGPVPLACLTCFALRETAPADKGQLVSVACDLSACIVVTETVFFFVLPKPQNATTAGRSHQQLVYAKGLAASKHSYSKDNPRTTRRMNSHVSLSASLVFNFDFP